MNVLTSISELRIYLDTCRREGKSIGLVPTMGALHRGHTSLVEKARANSDIVVVSIFVNPTQFGPNEDLERYPKPIEEDKRLCEEFGVEVLFLPSAKEMYPSEMNIGFSVGELGNHLCGSSRPGHFSGVVQIVNKLFNMVQPDIAVFGLKDIQQYRILEIMAGEFNHRVKILPGDTVREKSGLAISSRNLYLSDENKLKAPLLYQTLTRLSKLITEGNVQTFQMERAMAVKELDTAGLRVDYLELVDYERLQPIRTFDQKMPYILAGAVFLGPSRLIDNLIIS